jgi:hypothetical protein
MPSWESIGAAITALITGATGWGLGRRKERQAANESVGNPMDPEDWFDWRREVELRLRNAEQAQALGNQAAVALGKQVDDLVRDMKTLLREVMELRLGLGQHPDRQHPDRER